MAENIAYRIDRVIYLPMYANAEMLMLEFLKNETITIAPKEAIGDYTIVEVFVHVDILDELIQYINDNI